MKVPFVIFNSLYFERANNIKFLGSIVDDRLNWHEHINTLCNKIAKGIAMLHLSKTLFPLHVKRMLYYAYKYPHLIYCMPIWGGGHSTYVNKVAVLQKKVVCLIRNLNYLARVHPAAYELKLLLILELFIFQLTKLMHDIYYNNMVP